MDLAHPTSSIRRGPPSEMRGSRLATGLMPMANHSLCSNCARYVNIDPISRLFGQSRRNAQTPNATIILLIPEVVKRQPPVFTFL